MEKVSLPPLPPDRHYVRVTFSMRDCAHDYDGPRRVAAGYAREAGLEVIVTRIERGTVAVYAVEPPRSDVRAWERYSNLSCTSAQRFG